MIKLFSYGTLSDKLVQIKEFGQEFLVESDTFQVLHWKLETINISGEFYYCAVYDKSSILTGKIVHIPKNLLTKVDDYETSMYRRVEIKTTCGQNCIMYIKNV